MGHTARPDDRGRPGRFTLDQPLFPGRNRTVLLPPDALLLC
jgi:hypothetical protein